MVRFNFICETELAKMQKRKEDRSIDENAKQRVGRYNSTRADEGRK